MARKDCNPCIDDVVVKYQVISQCNIRTFDS